MKQQYLQIRTRNYTADGLKNVILTPCRAVFRLGSTTPTEEIFPVGLARGKRIIEINSAESCHNSGNKLIMKQLFDENNVRTAAYMPLSEGAINWAISLRERYNISEPYPAIIKHKNSSKGEGIYYIENEEELFQFERSKGNSIVNYLIEKYYNFSKEYRLHVTNSGCFYSCRKMLKQDAEDRWHRHDVNSVWILEENELFEKPKNWDKIIENCILAMNSVGLDICSCDVKVQTEKGKRDDFEPDFIIMEVNSASSLGEVGLNKYIEQLKLMIND